MEQRLILPCLLVLLLSSCTIFGQFEDTVEQTRGLNAEAKIKGLYTKQLIEVPAPAIKPIVAVYSNSFTDQTGQRASNSELWKGSG